MLQSLSIRNYALISHLEIDFPKGFSVMTGETGSGKSIILGALALILGQRADTKSIKQGEKKCTIEGVFDISSYNLESFFRDKDLEFHPGQCILRREIWESGKSRAFINDSPTGLNEMRELGSFLIDIHSQHRNLMLSDGLFQLQVLDILAGNKELRNRYSEEFTAYSKLKQQLKARKEEARKSSEEEDYIRFQHSQLEEAELQSGEQTELETEQETLSHTEEIKSTLFTLENKLSGETDGLVDQLKEALSTAQSLLRIYSPAEAMTERIESAYLDLKDLFYEVSALQNKLEHDPERLQIVSDRLDLIYSLQQKHHLNSVEELILLRDELAEKLHTIDNFDEEIEQLEQQVDAALQQVITTAGKLTTSRKKAATQLEKELCRIVGTLGMPNIRFVVNHQPSAQPDATGMDSVEYTFSANKNTQLQPVAQIASGGEISRLMLGIKALIAGATALPTIIFDEIDTGTSGEIADKIGHIMQEMGNVMQVITITHLPQIAAQGNMQYKVYKEESGASSETYIKQLNEEERIQEIAHMLSGSALTPAAIENAKELLRNK